tara:strand:- start:45 stop:326 length:282 start_codon:yes stop_codon:yes gene_type:complete
MESTKVIGFLILVSCPIFGFSNSDLQKWSSGKVDSSGHNAHAEIQAAISREVDDSIKASMQKKLDERITKEKTKTPRSSIALSSVLHIQQVGQ